MASSQLDTFFNLITSSEKGEEVRDAIINAALNLQKLSSNTSSLNGIPAEKFALSKDYLDLIVKIKGKPATEHDPEVVGLLTYDEYSDLEDDSHARSSENVINSGNLYAILENYIRPSLAYVIHYENDPESGTEDAKAAINAYIASLYEAKTAIIKAMKSKGYQDPTTFEYTSLKPQLCKDMREFAALIDKIGGGTPDLISGGTFSEQKTYEAGDGKAYSSFKVQCDDYFDTDTQFNESKTYTAASGKLFPKTINVSVNTRSSVSSGGVGGRTTGVSADDLTSDGFMSSVEITENGYVDAAGMGTRGWLSITTNVHVPDVAGKIFTVTFMYNGKEYGSTQVEAYGIARFDGAYPVHEDPNYEFSGWQPAPVFVTSNMTCEASFRPIAESAGSEIQDDWETIVINRGEPYNPGDYKTLTIGSIDGYNYGSMTFMKVAYGEDSTTSTWVTKTRHNIRSGYSSESIQWPSSPMRMFLNGKFIKDLSNGNTNCALIARAAVPVRKRTLTAINRSPKIIFAEMESVDTFWVPSAREMIGPVDYSEVEEYRWKAYYNQQHMSGTYYGWDANWDIYANPNAHPPYSPDWIQEFNYIDSYGVNYCKAFSTSSTPNACTISANQIIYEGNTISDTLYDIIPSDTSGYGDSFSTRTYGVSYNKSTGKWEWNNSSRSTWNLTNFKIGFCL